MYDAIPLLRCKEFSLFYSMRTSARALHAFFICVLIADLRFDKQLSMEETRLRLMERTRKRVCVQERFTTTVADDFAEEEQEEIDSRFDLDVDEDEDEQEGGAEEGASEEEELAELERLEEIQRRRMDDIEKDIIFTSI